MKGLIVCVTCFILGFGATYAVHYFTTNYEIIEKSPDIDLAPPAPDTDEYDIYKRFIEPELRPHYTEPDSDWKENEPLKT